jgi:hypothetical protein
MTKHATALDLIFTILMDTTDQHGGLPLSDQRDLIERVGELVHVDDTLGMMYNKSLVDLLSAIHAQAEKIYLDQQSPIIMIYPDRTGDFCAVITGRPVFDDGQIDMSVLLGEEQLYAQTSTSKNWE